MKNGGSYYLLIRCPFCNKSSAVEIKKSINPERKICPYCGRMYLVLKKRYFFGLFCRIDVKII
jgi:predicted transcriptional regulator